MVIQSIEKGLIRHSEQIGNAVPVEATAALKLVKQMYPLGHFERQYRQHY